MDTPARYLVVDLEATCAQDHAIPREQTEIIEIGAVLVDGPTLAPLREFQTFVKPTVHTRLTPFCTELTHIAQPMVDAAPRFPEAIRALERWLGPTTAAWEGVQLASWGAYDLNQLRRDAVRHRVALPFRGGHLNIKEAFGARIGRPGGVGMAGALGIVGLPLVGTHHRGIDDARNIARLLPYALGRMPVRGR